MIKNNECFKSSFFVLIYMLYIYIYIYKNYDFFFWYFKKKFTYYKVNYNIVFFFL